MEHTKLATNNNKLVDMRHRKYISKRQPNQDKWQKYVDLAFIIFIRIIH